MQKKVKMERYMFNDLFIYYFNLKVLSEYKNIFSK